MPISLRIGGVPRTRRNLRLLRRRLPSVLVSRGLRDVANAGAAHARRTRSYRNRTFKLRRSTRVRKWRRGTGYSFTSGGRSARYARFIELGTKYIRARRFMYAAFRSVRPRALRIVARRARRDFNTTVRKLIS